MTIQTKSCGVPSSFHFVDGCWNCAHVATVTEYDEGTDYYCTVDGKKRPLSGSVYMKERFFEQKESFEVLSRRWEKWRSTHSVFAWGKCGQWSEEPK